MRRTFGCLCFVLALAGCAAGATGSGQASSTGSAMDQKLSSQVQFIVTQCLEHLGTGKINRVALHQKGYKEGFSNTFSRPGTGIDGGTFIATSKGSLCGGSYLDVPFDYATVQPHVLASLQANGFEPIGSGTSETTLSNGTRQLKLRGESRTTAKGGMVEYKMSLKPS